MSELETMTLCLDVWAAVFDWTAVRTVDGLERLVYPGDFRRSLFSDLPERALFHRKPPCAPADELPIDVVVRRCVQSWVLNKAFER